MKTEMTLAIEKTLAQYDPASMCGISINKFRGRHTAFEVPAECGSTLFGIVDCVRICEYFGAVQGYRSCHWYILKGRGFWDIEKHCLEKDCLKGFAPGEKNLSRCDEISCPWNREIYEGVPKILITCYEIKVTKADIKSHHGHNFIGNLSHRPPLQAVA